MYNIHVNDDNNLIFHSFLKDTIGEQSVVLYFYMAIGCTALPPTLCQCCPQVHQLAYQQTILQQQYY